MNKSIFKKVASKVVVIILIASIPFSYSGCKDKNSNKKVLVWVTDEMITENDPHVLIKVNELLDKKNCNFHIKFEPESPKNYVDSLIKRKNSNTKTDIVFSEFGSVYCPHTFYKEVKSEIYSPLDDCFKEKDGEKLFNSINKAVWDGCKIDGKYYGIPVQLPLGYAKSWKFKKDLIKKYNIDTKSLNGPIWCLKDALEKVYNGEKNDKNFTTLLCSEHNNALCFYDKVTDCVGFRLNSTDKKAVNIYEDEFTTHWLKTLCEYRQKGYISEYSGGYKNINYFAALDETIPNADAEQQGKLTLYDELTYEPYTVPAEIRDIEEPYATSDQMQNMYNGIASWSQNKQDALKLLTLVNTDRELMNLLAFGIEKRNYNVKNDYVVSRQYTDENGCLRKYEPFNAKIYGNALIQQNNTFNNIFSNFDYNVFNKNIKKSPIYGFFFDDTKVKSQITKTNNIVASYTNSLWNGSSNNLNQTLNELNTKLKEAGIDDIINEVNSQIKDYNKM